MVAAVGVGGKGQSNIAKIYNGGKSEIAFLCDVDDARAATTVKNFPKAKYYKDYREMLDKEGKRIDAVVVSTPDHNHGVGKVTAGKMKLRGLHKGADLKKLTETELINLFGKSGRFFYNIVRGIDNRPVEPNQETKSISAEDTFSYDLTRFEEMNPEIEKIANVVFKRMKQYGLAGRTVTLKVKFSDFKQITRSKSSADGISELDVILDIARSLLAGIDFTSRSVRLLGLSLSNFGHSGGRTAEVYQARLFP